MKLIKMLLNSVVVMFVILFSLFFVDIYKGNKKPKTIIEEKTAYLEIKNDNTKVDPTKNPHAVQEQPILIIEPASKQNTQENKQSSTPHKFYYNQLNVYSKYIYDALDDKKDLLKTGNATIDLPEKLGESFENSETIEAIFSVAINAFEYDNPDLFYFNASKMMLYYEKSSLGNYRIFLKNDDSGKYLLNSFYNEQDVINAEKEIQDVVEKIENEVNSLDSDYKKIQYIHDWLAKNVEYDQTLSRENKDGIYGVFVEKQAVCGGYAKAFKYLLDKCNIDCIIVQGIGTAQQTENHAWNYVKINDKWYGVDCTWDDPVIIGDLTNYQEKIYYTYFLKGKNTFNNDHQPFETFYGTNLKIDYPEISNEDY